MMDRWLILASASPRRQTLLELAGIEIEVVPSGVEETLRKNEDPSDHVRRMAQEKTEAVAGRFPDRWVIGADTIVVIDGESLGKPKTQKDAREMLSLLSGRIHQVLTGYAVAMKKESLFVSDVVETKVKIKHLSLKEISWYVRTGEPIDKAGAYAIQGAGAFMIEEIRGSYTNVVGLPLCQVLESLRALGAIDLK
ncbi:MAG: septum formation inhibitor Maf [Proteobacteria bacterium]|nr:septum formation inhibitor Maf [Pseudomonadota bacterium]